MARYRDWRGREVRVDDLNFSVRVRSILRRRGIITLSQLCALSELEFLSNASFGETTMQEIRTRLAKFGLKMRGDEDASD